MNEKGPAYAAKLLDIKNLALFLLIAFGWTWFWWYLFISGVLQMPAGVGTPDVDLGSAGPILLIVILSPFGPTIAGFLVTARSEGRVGVRELWKSFWNRSLSLRWLLVILIFLPIVYLITRYAAQIFFGLTQPELPLLSEPWLILPPFIASILNGGLSEEFGWRGYALRHLQSKWNALGAALLLGLIEGCWHIPLTFMPGDVRFGMSIPMLVLPYLAIGIFRAWVFNNTGGSVLAAVLFHAAGNVASEIAPFNLPNLSFFYAIEFIIALIIVLVFGPGSLMREKQNPSVTAALK